MPGRRKERENINKKLHPPQFNFWVSFSRNGPGVLHVFDENLTGDMHYNILKTCVPRAAKKLFSGKFWLLTDNDPKTVTSEMREKIKKLKINRLPFSRYSPDLNVCENMIDLLNDKTAEKNPKTIDEAKEIIQKEFKKMPLNIFQGLVGSMDARCQAVIDAEGGYTDY